MTARPICITCRQPIEAGADIAYGPTRHVRCGLPTPCPACDYEGENIKLLGDRRTLECGICLTQWVPTAEDWRRVRP